jgi:hypothetical protein
MAATGSTAVINGTVQRELELHWELLATPPPQALQPDSGQRLPELLPGLVAPPVALDERGCWPAPASPVPSVHTWHLNSGTLTAKPHAAPAGPLIDSSTGDPPAGQPTSSSMCKHIDATWHAPDCIEPTPHSCYAGLCICVRASSGTVSLHGRAGVGASRRIARHATGSEAERALQSARPDAMEASTANQCRFNHSMHARRSRKDRRQTRGDQVRCLQRQQTAAGYELCNSGGSVGSAGYTRAVQCRCAPARHPHFPACHGPGNS